MLLNILYVEPNFQFHIHSIWVLHWLSICLFISVWIYIICGCGGATTVFFIDIVINFFVR